MNTIKTNIEQDELNQIAPKLGAILAASSNDCFATTFNYFDTLEQEIKQQAFVNSQNTFDYPLHYFEQVSTAIESHSLIKPQQAFIAPNLYFENLPQAISNRIGLSFEPATFEALPNYFDALPQKIQSKIYNQQQTKVIQLQPVFSTRLTMAAAIVVILFAGIFYLNFLKQESSNDLQFATINMNTKTEEILLQVDESMLIEALDQPEQIAISSKSNNAFKQEITDYLIQDDISIDEIVAEI